MGWVKTPERCASGGHDAEARDAGLQASTLPVGEEERLVRLNRTAYRDTVLIAAEFRSRPGLCEEVAGVQSFITEKFK